MLFCARVEVGAVEEPLAELDLAAVIAVHQLAGNAVDEHLARLSPVTHTARNQTGQRRQTPRRGVTGTGTADCT